MEEKKILDTEIEKHLRQFEKYLFGLGDEVKDLKENRGIFSSVFDETTTREGSVKKQNSILGGMISSILKEEKVVVEGEEEETEEDVADEVEESTDEPSEEILDDETIDAIIDDDVPTEEVVDDIEDIESREKELKQESAEEQEDVVESDFDFNLPQDYKSLEDEKLSPAREVFASFLAQELATLKSEEDEVGLEELDVEFDEVIQQEEEAEYKSVREFSEADEKVFFNHLNTYGVFIRKAVSLIIADAEMGFFSQRLVDLVLESAPPETVRRECEKFLSATIPIQFDYNTYNAEDLKEKLFTSTEKFRRTAEVTIKKILPLMAAVVLVAFFGFFFAVQPIRAYVNYTIGYKLLEEKKHIDSEKLFVKASDIWSMESFYFKYANEYIKQRKYTDSKKKYLQLVFGLDDGLRAYLQKLALREELFSDIFIEQKRKTAQRAVHFNKKGFLALGAFTRDVEGNFEEARTYYNTWLLKHPDDIEFYTEIANTYISWYDETGDLRQLDNAGASYDKAMLLTNGKDRPLIMRLRYSVRAQEHYPDEERYINTLQQSVLFAHSRNIPKTIALPFIELAEYKLNVNKANFAVSFLDAVQKIDAHYPHLDYLYARYYNQINDRELEKQYLERAQIRYETESEPRGLSRIYAIDTDIMLGDYFLNIQNNVFMAKNVLLKAQNMYESSIRLFLISKQKNLARLYVLQASIALRENDLLLAEELIAKARSSNYNSPALEYYSGLVNYLNKQYADAAVDFITLTTNYIDVKKEVDLTILQGGKTNTESQDVFNMLDNPLTYKYLVDRQQKAIEENKENVFVALANSFYFAKNYVVSALYYEKALQSILEKRENSSQEISSVDIKNQSDEYYFFNAMARIKNNLGATLYQLSKSNAYDRTYDNYSEFYTRAIRELQEANVMMQNVRRDTDESIRLSLVDLPQRNIDAILQDSEVDIYADVLLIIDSPDIQYYNTVAQKE